MSTSSHASAAASPLRERLLSLGQRLKSSLEAVLEALPTEAQRTGGLSSVAAVNKVFASRFLAALRQDNPLAVIHRLPGPDPLRRFLDGLRPLQLAPQLLLAAQEAVRQFQQLIEEEAGDRSALQTMMSSWLGEARPEFLIRRRQAAFKAVSELKGAAVDLNLSTAILHPAADPHFLDLVWSMTMIGLQRLRPGAQVRLDTRRLSDEGHARKPRTFVGEDLNQVLPGGLDAFCPHGPAPLDVQQVDGTMNYLLAGEQFGPRRRSDLLLVELNRAELRRFRADQPQRRSYIYANPVPPAQELVLDLFLHKSVLDREPPELLLYDTAGVGPRDPNDPLSRFELLEDSEALHYQDAAEGILELPGYAPYPSLVQGIMSRLDWQLQDFHLWRAHVAFPLHSSQVTMAFKPRPHSCEPA